MQSLAERKLDALAEMEGFDDVMDMLERAMFDGVAPGICKNKSCRYTCEVEPDSNSGWCEDCRQNTVVSCLVLAGVI